VGIDLNFWKYKENTTFDAQDVYKKLSDGAYIDGLVHLPIQKILKDVEIAFKSWIKESEYAYEGEHGAFTIYTTEQFVRFDCYGMRQDDLNRIIDVMYEYGCPLYDSQISVRFDGDTS